jgi:lipopolysaccharide cholinephosphotransferase
MENKELHRLQASMLAETLRIFEKHSIQYFLLGGSALGAVRHSGFIPWDDDIDIGLPRADYEKFLSIAPSELQDGLFLQSCGTDTAYPLPFAKIRNSNTTFIESSVSHLAMNHGVYIDLFPLDGYSRNCLLSRAQAALFRGLKAAVLHKFFIRKRLMVLHPLVWFLATFFSLDNLRSGLFRVMTVFDYSNADMVMNWNGAWGLREAMPKSIFGQGTRLEFAGIAVSVPSDYDGYLRALYGDYMKLPSLDKRRTRHCTELVDLRRSYTEYVGAKSTEGSRRNYKHTKADK